MTPLHAHPRLRAFTLVELLVAVFVGAIVAGGTTAAISGFIRTKTRAEARAQAFARANAAAESIESDATEFARDINLQWARVQVTDAAIGDADADTLQMFIRTIKPTRGGDDNPEGCDAEIGYKVANSPNGSWLALFRRCDPIVDRYPDAGGVVTLVADHIASVSITAADQQDWYTSWESDENGFPHGIQVTVTAVSDDGSATAAARRIIAMDRTPLPTGTSNSTDSSTSGSTTGSTTGSTSSSSSSTGATR